MERIDEKVFPFNFVVYVNDLFTIFIGVAINYNNNSNNNITLEQSCSKFKLFHDSNMIQIIYKVF